MGCYIEDQETMTKEELLKKYGTVIDHLTLHPYISSKEKFDHLKDIRNYYIVILVDNIIFKAAGVAFCHDELRRFMSGLDGRFYTAYLLPKSITEQYSDVKSWVN